MDFPRLLQGLADEFGLAPGSASFAEGYDLLFGTLRVTLRPSESGAALIANSDLGHIGTPAFQDHLEDLLVANHFSNPTGEGVLGIEASGIAVIRLRIPCAGMTPAAAASTLRRFAGHALHCQEKVSAEAAPLAPSQPTALEAARHGRV